MKYEIGLIGTSRATMIIIDKIYWRNGEAHVRPIDGSNTGWLTILKEITDPVLTSLEDFNRYIGTISIGLKGIDVVTHETPESFCCTIQKKPTHMFRRHFHKCEPNMIDGRIPCGWKLQLIKKPLKP